MSARPPVQPAPLVAVVAVHGIADQRRGDTGQAVALQLAAASGGHVQAQDLPLHVPPLDPAVHYRRWQPQGWRERFSKALRQSWRSDFLDDTLGGAPGSGPVGNSAVAGPARSDAAATAAVADVGVRFTDYLLAKAAGAREPGGGSGPASVPVHQVRGPHLQADVFEMHWADLSRLPGSVARIVAELFTLMFHLSRLGIDALSLADALAPGGELRLLRRLQRLADWWFTRVLALLGLQLLVVALVLLPALWVDAHRKGVAVSVAGAAGTALAGWLVYRGAFRWRWALPAGCAAFVGLLVLLLGSAGHTLLMLAWLLALAALLLMFLDYCEARFRAVWGVGVVMGAATLGGVLAFTFVGAAPASALDWVQGSFTVMEALLLAHAVGWGFFALLLAATVALTEWVLLRGQLPGTGVAQTLVTARLGLFTSAGAFLVCQMVGFELAAWALKCLLVPQGYLPWWFEAPEAGQAALFLQQRADAHSGSFSVVAVVLLVLLGFVALVFLPSVLRELRQAAEPDATRLGRWLTRGYRAVEGVVRGWGWPVALGAVFVGLLLLVKQADRAGWAVHDGPVMDALRHLEALDVQAQALSDRWLGKLVLLVAGGTAGLLALGKVAVRQLQALRAPLDAVLDVDNHFREFPRTAISRVLIIERYVALLDHLRQQGYTRVVLVAHSQGTVITAELLRYLQQRPLLTGGDRAGAAPPAGQVDLNRLRQWLDGADLRLLTMGCPLRQLYALRFPALYPWPVAPLNDPQHPGWCGPRPAELGLRHWSNLWGTGDYVGRWLWSAGMGADTGSNSGPVPLQVDDARYAGQGVQGEDAQGRSWKDQALGGDAHTHYFDLDQRQVAAELVSLVAG